MSGKSEGTVDLPVSSSSAESERVSTLSDSVKIEYRADDPRTDQLVQKARLNGPSHIKTLHAMVRYGKRVSKLSAFLAADKILSPCVVCNPVLSLMADSSLRSVRSTVSIAGTCGNPPTTPRLTKPYLKRLSLSTSRQNRRRSQDK